MWYNQPVRIFLTGALAMEKTDHPPEISPLIKQQRDDLIASFVTIVNEIYEHHNIEQFSDLITLIRDHQIRLKAATSDASTFFDVDQLEQLMLELRSRLNDASLKAFVDTMRHVNAEAEIIAQKKTPISKTKE
jgi:hypothetical protein